MLIEDVSVFEKLMHLVHFTCYDNVLYKLTKLLTYLAATNA